MRAIITNSYYTTDPLTIHWVGRREDGEKLFYDFPSPIKPYFFAQTANGIEKIETNIPSDVKMERDKYSQTWEADLVFPERVLTDMGFWKAMDMDSLKACSSEGINLRRFALDIETDDEVPLNIENPEGEILAIGFRDYWKDKSILLTTVKSFNTRKFLEMKIEEDNKIRDQLSERGLDYLLPHIKNLDVVVKQFTTEREMLSYYQSVLYSPYYGDVNVGWHIGGKVGKKTEDENEKIFGFDIPYIELRGRKAGLNFAWDKIVTNFDLRQAYRRLQENDLESTSLEFISQRELGIGKIKHSEGYREMYEKSPEKFLVYLNRDLLLVQLNDLKGNLFEFFQTLSEKVGSLNIGRWNSTYLIDSLLFHEVHETDQHMPTRQVNVKKGNVEGGKVLVAALGRFGLIAVLDFSGEYPSIYETFNLSPETLRSLEDADVKIPELGYGFSLKTQGFIPKAIGKLKRHRKEIKKRMRDLDKDSDLYKQLNNEQRAVKELTNAFYGIMGNPFARLYFPKVQAAVTYLTRKHILFVVEKINALGISIEVKYGDTDSVMIWKEEWDTMPLDDVIKEIDDLLVYINSTFPEFVRSFGGDPSKSTLEMKFEKIYKPWIQTGAKKNYSGQVVYKDGSYVTPYTEYRGLSPRRSDKSLYTKSFVKKFIDMSHNDPTQAWEYYLSEQTKWDEHSVDIDQIGIYFSLNQFSYSKTYQPDEAVKRSQREGIKLDRRKGKYRLYFLSNGEIAVNFDDPLPKKYHKILDWENHKRRCFLLPSQGVADIIRPNMMKDFESEDEEEIVLTMPDEIREVEDD